MAPRRRKPSLRKRTEPIEDTDRRTVNCGIRHRHQTLEAQSVAGGTIWRERLRPGRLSGSHCKPSTFLSLPLELRNQIYSYVLGVSGGNMSDSIAAHICYHEKDAFTQPKRAHTPRTAILRTNKQIHIETTFLLYKSSVFLTYAHDFTSRSKARWYVGATTPLFRIIRRITNLVLQIDIDAPRQCPNLQKMVNLTRLRIVVTKRLHHMVAGRKSEVLHVSGGCETKAFKVVMDRLLRILPCSVREVTFGVGDKAWAEEEIYAHHHRFDANAVKGVFESRKEFQRWKERVQSKRNKDGRAELRISVVGN